MAHPLKLVVLGAALAGAVHACSPPPVNTDGGTDTGNTDGNTRTDAPVNCEQDTDGDGIPDRIEGTGDADADGTPNYRDTDSDADGRPDALEANAGRPYDCRQTPVDSDRDGTGDFLDQDSDNNGIPDVNDFGGAGQIPEGGWALHPNDFDRDGIPDYADTDDDGDRISDATEIAPSSPENPVDTDGDGTPDYHDLDSDNDTISDADEGSLDEDGDHLASFRDDDSDGDGILDRDEAGDADASSPPVECARELNASTLMGYVSDGLADFKDIDSDNDGLSDREEVAAGTDRCNPDTDGDGQLDSAEVTWCIQNHRTGCATSAGTTIPSTDYYLILPNGGPLVNRELEFGTNIRVADVFFIFDTTGSMSSVQQQVANTIAAPRTGMIDSIRTVIMDTYFGVGHFDDFPTGGYGSTRDRAIHPLCDGPPGSRTTSECSSTTFGGIVMQAPAHAADVQSGALAIPGGSGNDGPESMTEALYQIVTNEGLYDHSLPTACAGAVGGSECWVRPTVCPEGTWGYPCFREGALAVTVGFTDASFHNGARDIDPPSTAYSDPYVGISPSPHNFDEMVQAYQRHSARQVGINANSGQRCEGTLWTNHSRFGPCFDYRMAAEGTGSVDLDGTALVYDLPTGGATSADFVRLVTQGINTLATRVPIDINTATRNDPANPYGIDATLFVKRRVPACETVMPRNTACWTESTGVAHNVAVARTDLSTFYRVVPGTRVRFTIYFQNDAVYEGSPTGVTLFHAYIDVRGDGITRLDTREVFILVPAKQPEIG
ncbi:MAG: hypothetical protein WCJ30_02370 [Deltaproteobacteria bacterium]